MSLGERLNDRWSGPLRKVPHRKDIAKTVQQGRAVENSADASIAITYALWLIRLYSWGVIAFGVLGVLDVALGAATSQWINLVLGTGFAGMAVGYHWLRSRARRSVSLNQGIAY
jgi:hypothetical protein